MYKLSGTVEKHLGRGRELGYPTANIPCPTNIPEGLYLGYVFHDAVRSNALIFIGSSVTFGETEKKCESYLLDFSGDLYGKRIDVKIVQKLRENVKFNSAEDLIAQMKKDEQDARAFFHI